MRRLWVEDRPRGWREVSYQRSRARKGKAWWVEKRSSYSRSFGFNLTARYLMGRARSRGPARCLILEARGICNFIGLMYLCPPSPSRPYYRHGSLLVCLTSPTYLRICRICIQSCALSPPHSGTRGTCHPYSTRFPKGRGRGKTLPRAGVEDITRTLPCRLPPIAMHRAQLRVRRDTAVYLHSRSKTGRKREVGAGGVPRQLRKVQCGVSERGKGGGANASMRAAVRAFSA